MKKIIGLIFMLIASEGLASNKQKLDLSKLHPHFSNPNYVSPDYLKGEVHFLYYVESSNPYHPLRITVYGRIDRNGDIKITDSRKKGLEGQVYSDTSIAYDEDGKYSVQHALPL